MLYIEVSLQELVLWNVSFTLKFLDQFVHEGLAQFSFFSRGPRFFCGGIHWSKRSPPCKEHVYAVSQLCK